MGSYTANAGRGAASVTAVADSFGEMGSLNADAKGRTRTRSLITYDDGYRKLDVAWRDLIGFGDVSEIGSRK